MFAYMDMQEWFRQASDEEKSRVASEAGTSAQYIYQLSTGRRRPSYQMAQKLATALRGAVTKKELRPDIWGAEDAA